LAKPAAPCRSSPSVLGGRRGSEKVVTRTSDQEAHAMATDAETRKFVQPHHGFMPKAGWIAHVKEVHGVPTLRGANRARRGRDVETCPPEKREAIEAALRHFGVI